MKQNTARDAGLKKNPYFSGVANFLKLNHYSEKSFFDDDGLMLFRRKTFKAGAFQHSCRRFCRYRVQGKRPSVFSSSAASFTLLELLIVITIIAIIAALLLPAFNYAREKAKNAVCQGNLSQLGIILFNYANDFDNQGPSETYWGSGASYSVNTLLSYFRPPATTSYIHGKTTPIKMLICPKIGGDWLLADRPAGGWGNTYIYSCYGIAFGTGNRTSTASGWICVLSDSIGSRAPLMNLKHSGRTVNYNGTEIKFPAPSLTVIGGDLTNKVGLPVAGYGAKSPIPHRRQTNNVFADGHVARYGLSPDNSGTESGEVFINYYSDSGASTCLYWSIK